MNVLTKEEPRRANVRLHDNERDELPMSPKYNPGQRLESFWSRVDKNGPVPSFAPHLGQCWLWTGGDNGKGYGAFWDGSHMIGAHTFLGGQAPKGYHWDHLCRVAACIRSSHLELVTREENHRRGIKGVLTTHCPQGHEFSEANTYLTARGHRQCRICKQAAKQRYATKHRRRAA